MTSDMRPHATLARLYIEAALGEGGSVDLPQAQAHYLGTVRRLKLGAKLRVFNGDDGEWLAEITEIEKRKASLRMVERLRPPVVCPDIWLLFAPIKKARTDFIVEKATELGASLIKPVITERTTLPKVRLDRMRIHAIEAAEQTERMDLPEISKPAKLSDVLSMWDSKRALIFADEAGDSLPAIKAFADINAPAAILIGPEGGFTPDERELLRGHDFVAPISLGPRILRADTAAAASLALWQAVSGDLS